MVYVSGTRESVLAGESQESVRTYANHQRADGEAGNGVLDQVRRAGSQQGRRGPHAVVIVGRAEGFAVGVNVSMRHRACTAHSGRPTYYPMVAVSRVSQTVFAGKNCGKASIDLAFLLTNCDCVDENAGHIGDAIQTAWLP